MEDKTINCRDCQADFTWSVADQEFFKEKGWENQPVRCEACRKAKKAQMDQRNGGGFGGQRGGFGAPRQGGNACYSCGQEGHRSFECPSKGGAGGGDRPARSNACFSCGQEGHRSFDCPSKGGAGGARGGDRPRSNACFSCGQEGHRSFDCPSKGAGGGRSGGYGGGERQRSRSRERSNRY